MKRVLKWLGALLFAAVVFVAVTFTLFVHGVIGPSGPSAEVIARSVDQRPDMLDRAYALPVARLYGRELAWQSNGSLCGPASVLNVLRSMGRMAEGDEGDVLEGTGLCASGMCFAGLSLDEVASVVNAREGLRASVMRDLSPEAFREQLRLSNDPSRRVIVNFTRRPIFGAGGGHHSPIGGYLEEQDRVLVLDVNRAYRPWLIERERLYAAVDTMDGPRKRGLLVIEATD